MHDFRNLDGAADNWPVLFFWVLIDLGAAGRSPSTLLAADLIPDSAALLSASPGTLHIALHRLALDAGRLRVDATPRVVTWIVCAGNRTSPGNPGAYYFFLEIVVENLKGVRVAILVEDGFEQVELVDPRKALDLAGAATSIVSPKYPRVRGWNFSNWGEELPVDVQLDRAQADNFDALHLPGGVMNPDSLRMQPKAVAFVNAFFDAGKPVAVICHGPWTIIEAGAARGRRIASWPSLKTDLRNAGAEWTDGEAVVDRNLVSSRRPSDIPAFNRAMVELFVRMCAPMRRTA